MKNLTSILVFLSFTISCKRDSTLVDGRVTDVNLYYNSKGYALPHVTFDIVVYNRGDREITLYINDYGRTPSAIAGSTWVYYNNEADSLELFSASCRSCREKTILQPMDSLNLTLKIHYSNVAKMLGSPNMDLPIISEIEKVFDTWTGIKYFDYARKPVFYVRRDTLKVD
jgi:hypothetical protein